MRNVTFLLVVGVGLFVLGVVQLLPTMIHERYFYPTALLCVGLGSSFFVYRTLREWRYDRRVERNLHGLSKEASEWIPMLYGNYTPYVMEAAEKLGDAREVAAVPTLMHVLEQTVNTQPPGWCEIAEAMVIALGKMGDRRALPLLHRLSNVRGIGLLARLQEAIDRIEPETSLLRPGSAENLPPGTLLRPVDFCEDADPGHALALGDPPLKV